MKGLYYFNLLIFILFVLCCIVNPVLGMISLIPLGIVQVFTGLYFVTIRDVISLKNQKLLAIYFMTIFGLFFLGVLISILPSDLKNFMADFFVLFPPLIPFYFLFVCYNFYKESNSKINKI